MKGVLGVRMITLFFFYPSSSGVMKSESVNAGAGVGCDAERDVSTNVAAVAPDNGGDGERASVDGDGAGLDGEGAGCDGEGAGGDGEGAGCDGEGAGGNDKGAGDGKGVAADDKGTAADGESETGISR